MIVYTDRRTARRTDRQTHCIIKYYNILNVCCILTCTSMYDDGLYSSCVTVNGQEGVYNYTGFPSTATTGLKNNNIYI